MISSNGATAKKIIRNGTGIVCRYNDKVVSDSTVTDGLILWFDGNDFINSPKTTVLRDRSGMGNTGIPSNFAYTGLSGSNDLGGIVFNKDSNCITVPYASIMNMNQEITIDCTVLLKSLPSSESNFVDRNGYMGYRIGIHQAGYIHTTFGWGASNYYDDYGDSTQPRFVPQMNRKYNYVWRASLIDGSSKLTVDGVLFGTRIMADSIGKQFMAGNTGILIGMMSNGVHMDGIIYSVKVYNRALTDAELVRNYNASK